LIFSKFGFSKYLNEKVPNINFSVSVEKVSNRDFRFYWSSILVNSSTTAHFIVLLKILFWSTCEVELLLTGTYTFLG